MASRENRLGSLEPMNQAIMHVVVITSFNLRFLLPSILCFFAAFTCVFVFFSTWAGDEHYLHSKVL